MRRGWTRYKKNIWNFPKLLNFVLYVTYFTLRIKDYYEYNTIIAEGKQIGKIDTPTFTYENRKVFMYVMNSVILFISSIYVLYFARIFSQFGRLTNIIG